MNHTLKKYSEWAPTPGDVKGLNYPNQQDWLVLPVIQTRDSGCLERANFQAAEESLLEIDLQYETWQKVNFRHWGPGWFEILLVKPNTSAYKLAIDICQKLDDYPILDENLLSELELEFENESWESWACDEWRKALTGKFPDQEDWIDDLPENDLYDLFRRAGGEVEHCDTEVNFDFESALENIDELV